MEDITVEKIKSLDKLFDSINFDDESYGDDWAENLGLDDPEEDDVEEDGDVLEETENENDISFNLMLKDLGKDIKLSVKAIIFNDEHKFLILQDATPLNLTKQKPSLGKPLIIKIPYGAKYVGPDEAVPKGYHLFTGPKGGHYYIPHGQGSTKQDEYPDDGVGGEIEDGKEEKFDKEKVIEEQKQKAKENDFKVNFATAFKLDNLISNDLGFPWRKSDDRQRSDVKHNVVYNIAESLEDHSKVDALFTYLNLSVNPYLNEPSDRTYKVTNELIHQWAESSGDNSSLSIALQLAAKDLFNLNEAEINHWPSDKISEATRMLDSTGSIIKDFIKVQYDETQNKLNEYNIPEHVYLFRGMGMTKNNLPKEFKDMNGTIENVSLQPISSFSLNYDISKRFSDHSFAGNYISTVLVTKVPRKNILSLSTTGFGCLTEGEVTVLGGQYPSYIQNIVRSHNMEGMLEDLEEIGAWAE